MRGFEGPAPRVSQRRHARSGHESQLQKAAGLTGPPAIGLLFSSNLNPMQPGSMNPTEIAFHLGHTGLTVTEKTIREIDKNRDASWPILVHLAKHCFGAPHNDLEKLAASAQNHLSDPKKHEAALTWLNEWHLLQFVDQRIGTGLSLKAYLKNDRNAVLAAITRLVKFSMAKEKTQSALRNDFDELKIMAGTCDKQEKKSLKTEETYRALKAQKEAELPEYSRMLQGVREVQENTRRLREKNLASDAAKSQLQKEIERVRSQTASQRHEREYLELKITRVRANIVPNASEIKRRRAATEQEYVEEIDQLRRRKEEKSRVFQVLSQKLAEKERWYEELAGHADEIVQLQNDIRLQEQGYRAKQSHLSSLKAKVEAVRRENAEREEYLGRANSTHLSNLGVLSEMKGRADASRKAMDEERAEYEEDQGNLAEIMGDLRSKEALKESLSKEMAEISGVMGARCDELRERMCRYSQDVIGKVDCLYDQSYTLDSLSE